MKEFISGFAFCVCFAGNNISQVISSPEAAVMINNKISREVLQNKSQVTETSNYNIPLSAISELPDKNIKYYALIIGINNYTDAQISALDKPINDAEIFYNTLTTLYTFEKENIKFLRDATNAQIIEALDYFAKEVKNNDNFLIFYAGHGYWNTNSEIGYWIPSDAQKNSTLNWFRNSTLRDYLKDINSKHTLLITDACFGGSIFKSRAAFSGASVAVTKLYELTSRKAMTSGTLTEVPDQSAFLKFLVERLSQNKDKYLSSEQLFSSFRIAVINNSNVVPQFGEIKDVGDEGGDFIFIHR